MTKRKIEDIKSKEIKKEQSDIPSPEVPQIRKRGRPRKIRPPEVDSALEKEVQNSGNVSRKNSQEVKQRITIPQPVHIQCDDATYYFGHDDDKKHSVKDFFDLNDPLDGRIQDIFHQGSCMAELISTKFEELTKLEYHIEDLLFQLALHSESLTRLYSDESQKKGTIQEVKPTSHETSTLSEPWVSDSESTGSEVVAPNGSKFFSEEKVCETSSYSTENIVTNPVIGDSLKCDDNRLENYTEEHLLALKQEINKRIKNIEWCIFRSLQEKNAIVINLREVVGELHTSSSNLLNEMGEA